MKTVIIVQARMTSTRLPGKVLKKVLGKTLITYLVERLRRVRLAAAIVVATTTNDTDLPIVALCEELGVLITRGSENDVLARYYEAAKLHQADVVVRITSDCPLIDPQVIDAAIARYLEGASDYVSTALHSSYPLGMAVEVFSVQVLEQAFREAVEDAEREHVTAFIYARPDRYRIGHLINPEDLSGHRWTVDTPEDLALVQKIIEALYPDNPVFGMRDVLEILKKYPDWSLINAHVKQKTLSRNEDTMTSEYKTEQEHFWAGEFGDAYVDRNQGQSIIAGNLALFSRVLEHTVGVHSAIEFGANVGMNLAALRTLVPGIDLSAIEINQKAVAVLEKQGGIKVYSQSILDFQPDHARDLVLIKGVLIHMNPDTLQQVYEQLYRSCKRYICVVEYYNPTPVAVRYRGNEDRLFKRDFAGEMLDRFPDLKLVDYGFRYHRDNNFPQDDITWFLMEKFG